MLHTGFLMRTTYEAGTTWTTFFVSVLPSKRIFRLFLNDTTPDTDANRVWSLPTFTFLPASIRVPRCRTIISPVLTVWPSARFTPRNFGCESLRFLAEPPAFLCAIDAKINVVSPVRNRGRCGIKTLQPSISVGNNLGF